jgi:hypothetical protein
MTMICSSNESTNGFTDLRSQVLEFTVGASGNYVHHLGRSEEGLVISFMGKEEKSLLFLEVRVGFIYTVNLRRSLCERWHQVLLLWMSVIVIGKVTRQTI